MEVDRRLLLIGFLAALLVGVAAALAWWGYLEWQGHNYFWFGEPLTHQFESAPATMPENASLKVNIDTGHLDLQFEDNSSLLYRIQITTNRYTQQEAGPPTVNCSDGAIEVVYPVADVTIILGSGTCYAIDATVQMPKIFAIIGDGARISRLSLHSYTGDIEVRMLDSMTVQENITVDIGAYSSTIDFNLTLPPGVGGRFAATIREPGYMIIDAPGWTQIPPNQYVSANYATAPARIDVTIDINYGTIFAGLK